MRKEELLACIENSNPDLDFLNELQEQLEAETKKPISEQNNALVDELTEAIAVLTGTDEMIQQRADNGRALFMQKISQQRRKNRIKRTWRIIPCACALVLIVSNFWSFSAYGMNVFSAAYQILNGGISIDFTKQDESKYETENPYKEDMQRLCSEHDIHAMLPTYIPSGFAPTDLYGNYEELELLNSISFGFEYRSIKLIFRMIQIKTEEVSIPLGIPSDHYNLSEQTIGDTVISMSKEDGQYQAAFMKDGIQYSIYADGLDYDECQRVLESVFD